MERSAELAAELSRIYDAISNGDAATLEQTLSDEDGVLFIGTDPDEWYDNATSLREMLQAQAAAGIKVEAGAIDAYVEGSVGWASDRGFLVVPDGTKVPFRITAVFHQEGGAWKVVQEHASIGVANEEAVGIEL